jgi:REP element-mobilizing transposase RayT
MPAYLFTYHAYRSWMPDRVERFVQRGKGLQPANELLAKSYVELAMHPPFVFDAEIQRFLIETVLDVCERRGWRLHGVATDPSHLHVLASWNGDTPWKAVRGKIRKIISLERSKRHEQPGRKWLSTDSSRKKVKDRNHFDHLMQTYLPNHRGLKWFEHRGWVD